MEAGMIQQWLLNIGVEIVPKLATRAELIQILQTGEFDLLQFGIVMSFNLCIGLVTPPVGLCLLLCNQTGETRLSHSLKAMMPMLLISIIVLFLITYVSPLTTLLPSIMAG